MKPKYHFFKNSKYALEGFVFMLKNELSFKIELVCIIPFLVLSLFFDLSLIEHLFVVAALVNILIVECINSAIEACVDLYTKDIHPLAKVAKDCASSAVFLSIVLAVIVYILLFFKAYF